MSEVWVVNRNNENEKRGKKERNYSLFAGINECSLLHIKKMTLLRVTVDVHMLSRCTGWMAFLQCVDRRKRLGGAESRSVGDSASPIFGCLNHLKGAAKKSFGTTPAWCESEHWHLCVLEKRWHLSVSGVFFQNSWRMVQFQEDYCVPL